MQPHGDACEDGAKDAQGEEGGFRHRDQRHAHVEHG